MNEYYGQKCKYQSITCMERAGCSGCEIELQYKICKRLFTRSGPIHCPETENKICDECIEGLRGHQHVQ